MTARAQVLVDPRRLHGPIDERIYGQFIEHVGRAVYGGVWDPTSPRADADGYRTDVIDACRGLRPPVLRWPGGNFASGYHWRDGVGPVTDRPTRRDLAWDAVETNRFGTEEFLELCRRLGSEAYLNLNVSTGTVDEAIGWLDYCNGTAPVPEVLLRQGGPHPDPHGVRIWGLGNENYGWWQHGHTTAESYAETAREWAKLLRWSDPNVELVVVGAPDPDWNWTVLQETARFAEFLSLHFYWHGSEADIYHSTLAGPAASEHDIVAAYGMSVAAARARNLHQPLRIAVDEWGVWSRTAKSLAGATTATSLMRNGLSARSGIDTRFEEEYDVKDALAVASWLHVMWRHPEKVGLATQAQMVNVIAPVHAQPDALVRHTVYWPLAVARAHARGHALDITVSTSSEVASGGIPGIPGDALPGLDVGGTTDGTALHLSLVNRLRDDDIVVGLDGLAGDARRIVLTADDPFAGNDIANPERVMPVEDKISLGRELVLPPHSHTTLILE